MKGYLTVDSQEDYENWLLSLAPEDDEEDEWDDWGDDEETAASDGPPSNWGWAWKEIK
jgi:hypothetical protein